MKRSTCTQDDICNLLSLGPAASLFHPPVIIPAMIVPRISHRPVPSRLSHAVAKLPPLPFPFRYRRGDHGGGGLAMVRRPRRSR